MERGRLIYVGQPGFISRGGLDFRRSHFACRLRDVVALLCKRMYEVAGKQSNYDRVTGFVTVAY